jgi:soluble lytic murein transglycosylase
VILLFKIKRNNLKYFGLLIISLLLIIALIDNSTFILKISYPVKYKEYVIENSLKNKIDPCLVFAIIKAESSFNPTATSRKNAKGLMQITDKTGKWGAESLRLKDYSNDLLYQPQTNIQIGCWYIGKLMKEFNNNTDHVIAAYNGGSGNVNEWLKDDNITNSENKLEKIP